MDQKIQPKFIAFLMKARSHSFHKKWYHPKKYRLNSAPFIIYDIFCLPIDFITLKDTFNTNRYVTDFHFS